jgi:hypothetical protein
MTKENVKPIQSEVSVETWKKLKMLAIQKDLSLSQAVREILERSMTNKKFEVPGE